MIPGMNQRQMNAAMRKMGITQKEIDAIEVVIRTKEEDIVIQNPSVSKIVMMGQQTYQVIGEEKVVKREACPEISDEDIKTVMEQAGASREAAQVAIKDSAGDLAQAILTLQDK